MTQSLTDSSGFLCFNALLMDMSLFYFFKDLFNYMFLYLFLAGLPGSSLLHEGFLWLWWSGATLCCGAQASLWSSFSCCGAWAPATRDSVVVDTGLVAKWHVGIQCFEDVLALPTCMQAFCREIGWHLYGASFAYDSVFPLAAFRILFSFTFSILIVMSWYVCFVSSCLGPTVSPIPGHLFPSSGLEIFQL